jgi:hypothetical protein
MTTPAHPAVERGRWFPGMPPALPAEDDDAYISRLTGALGADLIPYDHARNRQCSIGYHYECSERVRDRPPGWHETEPDRWGSLAHCFCPCHTAVGQYELRLWAAEESFIAVYGIANGTMPGDKAARILASMAEEIPAILEHRPQLAVWYLQGKP